MSGRTTALWQEYQFGDIAEFFDRQRVPLSGREREQRQGPYPYYGASGVIDHIDDYIFDGRYLLIAEDGENLNSRKLPLAFFADGKFWVNNHAHIVRGISGKSNDYFLKAWFAQANISGYITGAAQPKLTQANLKRIELRLPPIWLQERIASILSAYDDLIENNLRRIKILEEMAQNLYREWFVNFRFPGHEKAQMVDSELGKVPETWEVGSLQQVITLQRGFDLPRKQRVPGEVPIYAASGVADTHNVIKVKGPGVVTGRSGTLGKVMYIDHDFWPLNTTLWGKEYQRGTPLYAYYLLRDLSLEQYNSGAAVPTLNRNDIHDLPVVLPDEQTLARFDQEEGALHGLITLLREKTEVLGSCRGLILPKLISGELDVSELDIEIPEQAA